MTHYELFIPGSPIAQPRPRATIRGRHAGVYNPKTADVWKAQIVTTVRPLITEPLQGPLLCRMVFHLPRPKSHYGTGKNATKLKDSAPDWHTSKPDADNFSKAVLDSLTNAGMWRDDSQVSACLSYKIYKSPAATGMQLRVADLPTDFKDNF